MQYGQAIWWPAMIRSENGWLMLRHRQYWRELAREIPEHRLKPLEAKVAAGSSPGLDDYANLASNLSLTQLSGLKNRNLIVDFNPEPLYEWAPVLKLWGTLNVNQRRMAADKGLSIIDLNRSQIDGVVEFLTSLMGHPFIDEPTVKALLPGGGGLPRDLRLFAPSSLNSDIQGPDTFRWTRPEENNLVRSIPYVGQTFVFGTRVDAPIRVSIAFYPLSKT
jgi:hypothetical protein